MRVTIINPNSNLFGQSGEGSRLGSGNYAVVFKSGHELIFAPSDIEVAGEVKDEWVEPPRRRRSLWGSILFVLSLGRWKGN